MIQLVVVVVSLFPLGVGPEPALLRTPYGQVALGNRVATAGCLRDFVSAHFACSIRPIRRSRRQRSVLVSVWTGSGTGSWTWTGT